MSWKFNVIAIAVIIGDCTAVTSEQPNFHHLIISGEDDLEVEVCFNKKGNVLAGYEYYHLSILQKQGDESGNVFTKEIPLKKPIAVTDETICTSNKETGLTAADVIQIQEKRIGWLLTIKENGYRIDSFAAEADILMPKVLPVSPLSKEIYVIGAEGEGTKYLKIQEPFKQIFWDNTDLDLSPCDSGSPSTPCFYKLDLDTAKGFSFLNCFEDDKSETKNVPLCGGSKDGNEIKTQGDRLQTTVTVDYGAAIDVAYNAFFDSTNGIVYEYALITPSDKAILTISTCPVDACPVTEDLTVTLVSSTTFLECKVKDRKVDSYELAAGMAIVEVKWEKKDETYFQMSREYIPSTGDDSKYHSANVDCSLEETNCHAYFVDVAVGTHTIKIRELDTMTDLLPKNDIWQKTATTVSLRENRAIHAEPIDITVTESNIVLDVCFTYITNTSNVNTHYEFLAINSKGKWKKEIVNKKKDNSHACFHGLEVPLADFSEGSKFLVLLRDSDNGKPLASGEVTLDFPALRAIKPEVDNGNNGSTSTLAIVGAAIAGIACLMALVAAAIMFVMKINRNNDGLQYPLQHNNIEDASTIHGLDNSIPTM